MGVAGAMEALKTLSQSSADNTRSKNEFVGEAMAEASKLFDKLAIQGKISASVEEKEKTVLEAAKHALEIFQKSRAKAGTDKSEEDGLFDMARKLAEKRFNK
jgi:hypothetical protein